MGKPIHARKLCSDCPFKKDTPPGQFSSARYERLRALGVHDPAPREGQSFALKAMFACHQTGEGKEVACAGWLAVCGENSLTVRLNIALGALPEETLTPGKDWPDLFQDYDSMAAAQGGEWDDPEEEGARARPTTR